MPPTDIELLRQFASEHSEAAFATLVERHIGLVFSAALRQTGDPHAAEEITQAVFIILARKAGSLGGKVVLPGWLYQTARLTAANYLRTEIRRARREQEAHMNSLVNETEPSTELAWQQIAPLLDTAMGGLNEADRNAIVLRFFENKSMGEIAATLDAPEATARKRVTRAVERLRKFFTQRGVTLTAAAIVGAVSANSVQAAPLGLVKTISVVAIAKGAAVGSSTIALVKGALKTMAWTKAKMAIVTGVVVLLAAGTATVTIKELGYHNFNSKDFWATEYATSADGRLMTNDVGRASSCTFPASPVELCSINGLLNQCMSLSGWQYLIDKDVAAGSVKFGHKELNGAEWLTAFENALQTNKPGWWDAKTKKYRQENIVLIRYPEQKTVLVLPKDKAAKYQ